jgi:hypothetical protein
MAATFSVDTREVEKLARMLQTFKRSAVPHAVRETLNRTAFEGRKGWQARMKHGMILRNHWTAGSVRVEKAMGTNIPTMESRIGSALPYLETQESGGVEHSHGKHGVTIPTTSAAGQAMKARPRRKLVQKKNWMGAINLAHSAQVSGGRWRRNAVTMAMAEKRGQQYVFLDLGRRKGIFKISRTSKGRMKVRMIWDLTRPQVTIHARPTLEPTIKMLEGAAPEFQKDALIAQLRKAGAKWL